MVQSAIARPTGAPFASDPVDIELQPDDVDPVRLFLAQHHTAMLVVMFTDVKGSTELAEQHGEVPSQRMRIEHNALLLRIIERDGAGKCIKTIGDALMCIFAQPSVAVERALQVQRELAAYNAAHPGEDPLRVRIGIHLGQVMIEDQVQVDVFGRHVNRAARVESLADAGQILLTFPVYDSAKGWVSEQGHAWQDHGYYKLKGIDEPTRIFEAYLKDGPGPRAPQGNRVRPPNRIAWAVAAVAACAITAALAWWLSPGGPPLEAELTLSVLRGGELAGDLNDVLPLETGDELQLIGLLNRPAYAGLLWIDHLGAVQIVATSGDERVKSIRFPMDPDAWVSLEGGTATETAILLVDQAHPIKTVPPALQELIANAPLPVVGEPMDVVAVRADRQGLTAIEPSGDAKGLGKVQRHDVEALQFKVDRMREVLNNDVGNFRAWVLPHR